MNNVKVYVVMEPTYCGYRDFKIELVFINKQAAENYVAAHSAYCYEIQEWDVIE